MTYYAKARKRWRKAEWITGYDGQFALLTWIHKYVFITLCETREKAIEEAKTWTSPPDFNIHHEIIDLSTD